MASLLLDKLEALKSNEIKLKEERRALEEELELEMEKKRRLKMEATLTKLEVQVDDLDNDWYPTKNKCRASKIALCYINSNNKNKIVPLFRTMIGIMAKQQRDIDELKNRV